MMESGATGLFWCKDTPGSNLNSSHVVAAFRSRKFVLSRKDIWNLSLHQLADLRKLEEFQALRKAAAQQLQQALHLQMMSRDD